MFDVAGGFSGWILTASSAGCFERSCLALETCEPARRCFCFAGESLPCWLCGISVRCGINTGRWSNGAA